MKRGREERFRIHPPLADKSQDDNYLYLSLSGLTGQSRKALDSLVKPGNDIFIKPGNDKVLLENENKRGIY